ncbi:MAG: hypothetical protein HY399_03630 [Elusimicrobia bacterium]|nr:hypothetical protein [Elusimicrobiota bacterium]
MSCVAKTAIAISLGLFLSSAWAGGKFTPEQLKAQFYYDLGPSEIDVSGYPKDQQENYKVFKRTCSQCHTLARPVNNPLIQRADWDLYVSRMHVRTKVRPGTSISRKDARRVLNFLTYDSKMRKIDHKADFEAKTKELLKLFEEVKKERLRMQIEQDKKKIKESAPYTGTP